MVVTLLGLISGAVFPIALLPPVLRDDRRVEPVRDRDRRRPRRADRRHGLGAPPGATCCGWRRCRSPGSRSACCVSAGRSRESAAAAHGACTDGVAALGARRRAGRPRPALLRPAAPQAAPARRLAHAGARRGGSRGAASRGAPRGGRRLSARALLRRVRAATDAPIIVMKGPEVAARWPHARLRPWKDLDLLVEDAERRAARAARRRLRRDRRSGALRGHPPPAPARAPGLPLSIEVHMRPKWPTRRAAGVRRARRAARAGRVRAIPGVLAPSPAHHAVLLAAHAWEHDPLSRLGSLADIAAMTLEAGRDEAAARRPRAGASSRLWARRARDRRGAARHASRAAARRSGAATCTRRASGPSSRPTSSGSSARSPAALDRRRAGRRHRARCVRRRCDRARRALERRSSRRSGRAHAQRVGAPLRPPGRPLRGETA